MNHFEMRKLGWKTIWVLALHLVVSPVLGTEFDSPAMVEKVTKAVPTDELIVVVHQLRELDEPTISFLDQAHYGIAQGYSSYGMLIEA